MKTRLGMVPNSSAASFIVSKKKLSKAQRWLILHHHECFHLIGHDDAIISIFLREKTEHLTLVGIS